jgi:hypothetical protein
LKRKANFTSASSDAREAEAIAGLEALLSQPTDFKICAGDFFDKANNSEDVINSTLKVAGLTDVILAGNHDVKNNVDSVSSLHIINEVHENVMFQELDDPKFLVADIPGQRFFLVPHVLSQEDFLTALEKAETVALKEREQAILILHCNYNVPMEMSDISLVLTRERAKELLGCFREIWIGHEHNQKEDFDGRLKLIGSWRPTAFDNLTDKRILRFNTETKQTTSETVWSAEDQVYTGPSSNAFAFPGRQYYDLTDDMEKGETQKVAVKLLKQGAFGVRIKGFSSALDDRSELSHVDLLPEVILNDLKKNRPDLVSLYQEYLGTTE